MSISFSRSIENAEGRDFYYTTIESIRQELEIPTSALTDARANKLIRRYSKYLNKITGQWFEPIHLIRHLNGLGQRILDLGDGAPLLFLKSAEIVRERTQGTRETFDYVSPLSSLIDGSIEERFLSINPSGRGLQCVYPFPRGTSNIFLDGWWAKLEQPKYLETYISSGIVTVGTNSLQLQGTKNITQTLTFGLESYTTKNPKFGFDDNIRERDVIIFVDSDERELGRRIINSIDYSTNMVTFDAFLSEPIETISSGIKVLTFGAIPEDIKDIVNQFIVDNYQSDDSSDEGASFRRGIKQEKTDLYQYTRFTPLEGGTAINEELTSSPIINNLIKEYCVEGHVSI